MIRPAAGGDDLGGRPFVDDRHALYVGWVCGIAWRNGIEAVPVTDDAGNTRTG